MRVKPKGAEKGPMFASTNKGLKNQGLYNTFNASIEAVSVRFGKSSSWGVTFAPRWRESDYLGPFFGWWGREARS